MLIQIQQAALWLETDSVRNFGFDRLSDTRLTLLNTEEKPAQTFPALLRRRLSTLGKVAVQAALCLYRDQDREQKTPIIFATRWADIGISVQLLESLAKDGSISPMGFSTSVHNGIAGLFSIGMHHTGPMTTISGGQAQIGSAWCSAAGYFAQGCSDVLIIGYDQGSPSQIQSFHPTNSTYAWALRLTPTQTAGGYSISTQACTDAIEKNDTMSPLITLYELFTQKTEIQEIGSGMSYCFTRHLSE